VSEFEHDVEAWVRSVSRRDLLPARRADAALSGKPAELLDVLALDGVGALAITGVEQGYLVVPVAAGAGAGAPPRRAVPGDGVAAAMLQAMRRGGVGGAFRAAAFGDREIDPRETRERAIDVDQSNESVVVGEDAVVKLSPLVSAGPQPGVDLPVHLAAVGFTWLPAPLGALWWTSPAGDEVLLATASTFLPGARDGWEWYLDLALQWLDGAVHDAAAFAPANEVGRIAARMHVAFATVSTVVPEPIARADDDIAAGWRRAALAVADEALACTDGEEGARLASRADAIRGELDALGNAEGAVMTHVHGDFHVGQVLEWADGYAVTDLDGDPTAAPAERGVLDTPVRDVAAFVRSIDHLGRVASTRRPDRGDAIERWIAISRAAFLDAYVGELEATGHSFLFEERLLRPFEVMQECHEYVYAARFLPRWRYVPDLAICAMFPAMPPKEEP
jgi:maltokinase